MLRNQTINKYAFATVVIIPLFADAGSANNYVCKMEPDWLIEPYIFIDGDKLLAKMGTGEQWGNPIPVNYRASPSGLNTYSWSHQTKRKTGNYI